MKHIWRDSLQYTLFIFPNKKTPFFNSPHFSGNWIKFRPPFNGLKCQGCYTKNKHWMVPSCAAAQLGIIITFLPDKKERPLFFISSYFGNIWLQCGSNCSIRTEKRLKIFGMAKELSAYGSLYPVQPRKPDSLLPWIGGMQESSHYECLYTFPL